MNNYRKLNIPTNPVKDIDSVLSMNITGGYNLRYPKDILNDEILETFETMKLVPKFVVLFGRNDSDGKEETRMIHSDIKLTGKNKLDKSSWTKMLFGINWELKESHNVFSWWDMSTFNECYPQEIMPKKYDFLNGIHYVKRANLGIPEGAIKVEETIIDQPTLVRTDIPHMTIYKNKNVNRVGISVRFDESQFQTWENVYKFFDQYSIN